MAKKAQSSRKFFLRIIGCIFFITTAVFLFLNLPGKKTDSHVEFGVNFSPLYAESFGLDWKKTYLALLEELGVRRFRLAAYWNMAEPQDDAWNFESLDFQLDEAAKADAKVILAVGRKLPRWPECHTPSWVDTSKKKEMEAELLEYVQQVVKRYKDHPAVERWQVENEILFPFGICPNWFGLGTLKKEIMHVRSLSSKPIVVTDSGEWTAWIPISFYGDMLGISMYRESWNDYLGYIPFPIRPGYYQSRASLISPWKKNVIVTELQTEPWSGKGIKELTNEEIHASMSIEKMSGNIEFAKYVGFPEVYLWGAEVWYWLKEKGDPSYWDAVKEEFKNSP